MAKQITLTITRASLVVGTGPDRLCLFIEGPDQFPIAGYGDQPTMEMTTQKGYGIEWCEKVFGITPEVINGQTERGKFSK